MHLFQSDGVVVKVVGRKRVVARAHLIAPGIHSGDEVGGRALLGVIGETIGSEQG